MHEKRVENTAQYANVRDYQILDLSFLLSRLPSLKQGNACKGPGSHLTHSRQTSSGSCPGLGLGPCLSSRGKSKVLPPYIHAPSPHFGLFLNNIQSLPGVQWVGSLAAFLP